MVYLALDEMQNQSDNRNRWMGAFSIYQLGQYSRAVLVIPPLV